MPDTTKPTVTEGELHAARDETGLTLLPGHADTLALWENSEEGKKFINETIPEREKQHEIDAKRAKEDAERDQERLQTYERKVAKAQEEAREQQTTTKSTPNANK